MSVTLLGASGWSMDRDAEGHRTYKISWKLVTTDKNDGPLTVLACPSLPYPGQFWYFGNDADPYAFCLPSCSVKKNPAVKTDNPFVDWVVDQTFSTKPVGNHQQRDPNTPIEDPLLEPQKVSGSFVQYTEEGTQDRFGNPIVNSAWEYIRGSNNEWDANRNSIEIEQNVPDLQLALVTAIGNSPLNNAPLWGCPARSIKLSRFTWERKFFSNSYVYYTRKFGFDIRVKTNPQTGLTVGDWDRDFPDQGTKVLRGRWNLNTSPYTWVLENDQLGNPPSPYNPGDFIRFTDPKENPATVMLDGKGKPAGGTVINGDCGPWIISIVASGLGNHNPGDLNDPTTWVRCINEPVAGNLPAWQSQKYPRGIVVYYSPNNTFYVQKNPAGSSQTPTVGNDWVPCLASPNNRGAYDIDQYDSYDLGDYISLKTSAFSSIGNVHVEKYGESNLLLLNIPLTF